MLCTLKSGTYTVVVRVRLTGPGACRFSLFKAAAATASAARAYRVMLVVVPLLYPPVADFPAKLIVSRSYNDILTRLWV